MNDSDSLIVEYREVLVKAASWKGDTLMFEKMLKHMEENRSLSDEDLVESLKSFVVSLMAQADTKERYYYALTLLLILSLPNSVKQKGIKGLKMFKRFFDMGVEDAIVGKQIDTVYQKRFAGYEDTPWNIDWFRFEYFLNYAMLEEVSEERKEGLEGAIEEYGREQDSYYATARYNR